jgi:hypothetical protein
MEVLTNKRRFCCDISHVWSWLTWMPKEYDGWFGWYKRFRWSDKKGPARETGCFSWPVGRLPPHLPWLQTPTSCPPQVISRAVWLRSRTSEEGQRKTTNMYHPKKSRGKNEKSNFIFGNHDGPVDRLCNDASR